MAYDQNNRMNMNANKKEASNSFNSQQDPARKLFGAEDTEFSTDSWMDGVMNPKANQSNGNYSYNPNTQTESYSGGDTSATQANLPSLQANANSGSNQHTFQSSSNANEVNRATNTEMAAEVAPMPRVTRSDATNDRNTSTNRDKNAQQEEAQSGSGLGMVGLGASILSLFLLPYLLGPIGIVLGYLALQRGSRSTGTWAMILGAVAILGTLLVTFFTAF